MTVVRWLVWNTQTTVQEMLQSSQTDVRNDKQLSECTARVQTTDVMKYFWLYCYSTQSVSQCYHVWRCWLGGRKVIRPVKTECWGAGVVVCLEQGADLHMAQLMPLPLTVSCFSKIQIGFTFLIPAHLGSPGKRAIKRVCVFSPQIWRQKTSSRWWIKNATQCFTF